jgi:hypothetical protein
MFHLCSPNCCVDKAWIHRWSLSLLQKAYYRTPNSLNFISDVHDWKLSRIIRLAVFLSLSRWTPYLLNIQYKLLVSCNTTFHVAGECHWIIRKLLRKSRMLGSWSFKFEFLDILCLNTFTAVLFVLSESYYGKFKTIKAYRINKYIIWSRDSSVGIATGYGLAGRPGVNSRQGQEIPLYSTASRRALGPAQPPIQWVSGALSPAVKRLGCEADHSPRSRAEVGLYLHSHMSSWHGV